jgi:hypothetical protein
MDAVGRADIIRTGRNQTVFNSVVTKIAFLSNAFMRIKVDGLIRAGLDTCLATGTQIVIHYHDPIGSLAYCRFGTGVNAGGLIAMPAYINMENKI